MNKNQYKLISESFIKRPEQRRAVAMVVLESKTAYEAEMSVYGSVTNTVKRDAKRCVEKFDFMRKVLSA